MAEGLPVVSKMTQYELIQAALWAMAFVGISVLVAFGKVQTTMLENLLFGLMGAMAMKGKDLSNHA